MKTKIVAFFKVSGRQKILENFLSLGFVKGLTLLLPLLIIPHLIQTIGLELIGVLAIVTAICAYLNTVIDYGFAYTGTREISINNLDKIKNTKVLVDITTCKLFLSFLSLLFIYLFSNFVSFINDHFSLIFLSSLNIIFLSLCPSWFFQGIEDMKKIAIGEVFGKIISFILIIVFIKNKNDLNLIPLFYMVGQVFSLALYIVFIAKYVSFANFKFAKVDDVIFRLRRDWDMFVNILFPNFYNIYSYLVLGFFGTLVHVAVYDIARKVMNVSEQALGIVSKVYFPVLAKNINKFKEFLRVVIISSFILFLLQLFFTLFGLSYISDQNLDLLNDLMYIQLIAPFVYGLMIAYGINFLGALGKDKVLRNITIVTSIIGFITVTILTYFFMAIGALVGVIFTWLVRFVMCYISTKKILVIKV